MLAGPCILGGNSWQQMSPPSRQGRHGDRRHCGCQPVAPQSRGVSGQVLAGPGPGRYTAVRADRLGPQYSTVSLPLYCGGHIQWAPLQQRLPVHFYQGSRWGRLWEVPCAHALRMSGVRALCAVFSGRAWEE